MTDQKTLLILDDEPSILDSFGPFFEDLGFKVFTAENGQEGLEIFNKEPIAVVLTDLRMPKKDGFEVMEEVMAAKPETQVIVVSGVDKNQELIRALRMGAKDYIIKPVFDLEMIGHSVNRAFDNYQLLVENERYRKALEKSEHYYRTITENIAEGVFVVDNNQKFTYVNQAFCTIAGYTKEDLLSTSLDRIANRKSIQTIRHHIHNYQNNEISRLEIQLDHQGKNPIHVELACKPFLSNTDNYEGFIAVVRDITELTELRETFKKFLSRSKTTDADVLPICANCKKIKVTEQKWTPIEEHFIDIVFSHGICPECCEKLYPQFDFSDLK